jgi:hypothetical protein
LTMNKWRHLPKSFPGQNWLGWMVSKQLTSLVQQNFLRTNLASACAMLHLLRTYCNIVGEGGEGGGSKFQCLSIENTSTKTKSGCYGNKSSCTMFGNIIIAHHFQACLNVWPLSLRHL